MSKLTELLRNTPYREASSGGKTPTRRFMENTNNVVVSPSTTDGGLLGMTDADLEQIKSSVVEIDTNDKDRMQIIIGMYGGIKNPQTGKRFNIPGVDFTSDNYSYQYAEMMRLLVNRPDEFKKIMNWE